MKNAKTTTSFFTCISSYGIGLALLCAPTLEAQASTTPPTSCSTVKANYQSAIQGFLSTATILQKDNYSTQGYKKCADAINNIVTTLQTNKNETYPSLKTLYDALTASPCPSAAKANITALDTAKKNADDAVSQWKTDWTSGEENTSCRQTNNCDLGENEGVCAPTGTTPQNPTPSNAHEYCKSIVDNYVDAVNQFWAVAQTVQSASYSSTKYKDFLDAIGKILNDKTQNDYSHATLDKHYDDVSKTTYPSEASNSLKNLKNQKDSSKTRMDQWEKDWVKGDSTTSCMSVNKNCDLKTSTTACNPMGPINDPAVPLSDAPSS